MKSVLSKVVDGVIVVTQNNTGGLHAHGDRILTISSCKCHSSGMPQWS